MAGLIFAISILAILTTVGFLFAWMVRLASLPESDVGQEGAVAPGDLSPTTIRSRRR